MDELFDKSFPNAVDFAVSLFKQKLADDERDIRREEAGESGFSFAAIALALQGAAAALDPAGSGFKPLPECFPVLGSPYLEKAGVPLTPDSPVHSPFVTTAYLAILVHAAVGVPTIAIWASLDDLYRNRTSN